MKIKNIRLTLWITLIMFSNITSAQEVRISGGVSDKKAHHIKVYAGNPFFTEFFPTTIISSTKTENGTFALSFQIEKPQIINFQIDNTQYVILVSPRDVIHCTQKQSKIIFHGKNAASYNFLNTLWGKFGRIPYFRSGDDPVSYQKMMEKLQKDKLEFLDSYALKNYMNKESKAFFARELKYESALYKASVVDEKISFDKDELLDQSPQYRSLFIFKKILQPLKKQTVDEVCQKEIKGLKGKNKEFFLTNLFGIYGSKPEAKKEKVIMLLQLCDEVKDPVYKDYINRKKGLYLVQNNTIPDSILKTTVLEDTDQHSMTLGELLEKYKNKAVYIDFWASWCFSCRYHIADSKVAKDWILSKNIAYVYLSIDDHIDQWKKALLEDKLHDHQFVFKERNTLFRNYIALDYVPRYLYLNASHQIESLNAPPPIESELNNLKKVVENQKEEIIHYE